MFYKIFRFQSTRDNNLRLAIKIIHISTFQSGARLINLFIHCQPRIQSKQNDEFRAFPSFSVWCVYVTSFTRMFNNGCGQKNTDNSSIILRMTTCKWRRAVKTTKTKCDRYVILQIKYLQLFNFYLNLGNLHTCI